MDTLKTECDQCGTNNNSDNQAVGNVETKESSNITVETFKCEQCNREFSKKASLRRHVVAIHEPKPEPKPNPPGKLFQCYVEGCTFETNHSNNLKRHDLKVHQNPHPKQVKVMEKCSQCEKRFSDLRNLRFHMRKVHKTGDLLLEVKRQCPLCPFTSTDHDKKKIHDHFEDVHQISMVWEDHQFNSMSEFVDWKKFIEKETTTYYVRAYCTPTKLSFQCHRSGWYKKKGFDKRRLKTIGSCKINAFCPSSILVKISDSNVVTVSYLATHVGHSKEPEHIPMTPEERAVMKAQRAKRKSKQSFGDSTLGASQETPIKRSNTEIEMEKLMMEVQQDMEECHGEMVEAEPTIFLEHVADVHPSTVECLNLQNGMVENCQIMVTSLDPTVINCIDIQVEKNKFLESFIKCINENVQTLGDLEYVRQHCQTILPSLRESSPSHVSVITQVI